MGAWKNNIEAKEYAPFFIDGSRVLAEIRSAFFLCNLFVLHDDQAKAIAPTSHSTSR